MRIECVFGVAVGSEVGPGVGVVIRAVAMAVVVLGVACQARLPFSSERKISTSVSLGRETRLVVDSTLPIELYGRSRLDELLIEVDATLTASSAELAESLAENLTVVTSHPDESVVVLSLPEPDRGGIEGTFKVTAPRDLDLDLVERTATAVVEEMDGRLQIQSASHVRLVGARSNAAIRVSQGSAWVSAFLLPATTLDIQVGVGDIRLAIPRSVSVDLTARGGRVTVEHPQLPRALDTRLPYHAVVGGALSTAVVATGQGEIYIGAE